MILQEIKRCWKAKINIAVVILMIVPIVAVVMEDWQHRNHINQVVEWTIAHGDPDGELCFFLFELEGRNGLFFFERLFSAHMGTIFFSFVIFVIGVGINVSGNLLSALKTGYGINIVTRVSYKSYLNKTVISQFLYITTFLSSIFLAIFIVLLILGGGSLQTPGMTTFSFQGVMATPIYLLTLFMIVLYAVICKVLLLLIATLSFVFLKNKYLIQFSPVAIFVGVYILAFIFGNMNNTLAIITTSLIFEQAHFAFVNLFSWQMESRTIDVFYATFYPLLLLGIFFILYVLNVKKYGRDYLP